MILLRLRKTWPTGALQDIPRQIRSKEKKRFLERPICQWPKEPAQEKMLAREENALPREGGGKIILHRRHHHAPHRRNIGKRPLSPSPRKESKVARRGKKRITLPRQDGLFFLRKRISRREEIMRPTRGTSRKVRKKGLTRNPMA